VTSKHAEAAERHRAAWNALMRAAAYYRRDRDDSAPLRCPPGSHGEARPSEVAHQRSRQPH
jgi:hypothetical protein